MMKKRMKLNLIERWKNRETKKKLRDENVCLKAKNEQLQKDIRLIMNHPSNVCTIERNVQKVMTRKIIPHEIYMREYPSEDIKYELCNKMVDFLIPFVEYDFSNDENMGRVFTATLYVATGDRRR